MISQAVTETLTGIVTKENIHIAEPLSKHTSFKIGGPADCLVEVENTNQLREILKYLRVLEEPYVILGNGSNLLIRDGGIRGIVIKIGDKMSDIRVEGNQITVQAGALLSRTAKAALDHGLTGLEFASGIPGTVGGAAVMNAGAYGGEMKQVVTSVTVLDPEGEELVLDNETMEFGYRTSVIKHRPFIVTEVVFTLSEGDPDKIRSLMEELAQKRREKQPLEYPSAGSTFKRPEGYFAGELIMNAGLRGYRQGGARVSEKHCGFVINTGGATAADVLAVMDHVRETVLDKYQVELEPEVIVLGEV